MELKELLSQQKRLNEDINEQRRIKNENESNFNFEKNNLETKNNDLKNEIYNLTRDTSELTTRYDDIYYK